MENTPPSLVNKLKDIIKYNESCQFYLKITQDENHNLYPVLSKKRKKYMEKYMEKKIVN